MERPTKWRTAFLAGDAKLHDEWVDKFKQAYEWNGKPKGMAIYTHNDSFGKVMALSITPESVPYCSFSANWNENDGMGDFGLIGWTAGDEAVKGDP